MANWQATYKRLSQLDEASPLDPPRLVELATSAFLIGKDSESLAALMRAHQGFVHTSDPCHAAGIAARIASVFMNGGDTAQAAGWMARAARLLDESGESGAERGHLRLLEARQSLMSGNVAAAEAAFAEAADIAARFGDADLINLARQGRGRVFIELGQVERGVGLLDEVMVSVMAGAVGSKGRLSAARV